MGAKVPHVLDVEVTIKKTVRLTVSCVNPPSNEEMLEILQQDNLIDDGEALSVTAVTPVYEEVREVPTCPTCGEGDFSYYTTGVYDWDNKVTYCSRKCMPKEFKARWDKIAK